MYFNLILIDIYLYKIIALFMSTYLKKSSYWVKQK